MILFQGVLITKKYEELLLSHGFAMIEFYVHRHLLGINRRYS